MRAPVGRKPSAPAARCSFGCRHGLREDLIRRHHALLHGPLHVGWPVQFIPTFNALTDAAVRDAESGDLDGVPLRVVRADYLAVIALSVGRAKDLARVVALREAGAASDEAIAKLADQHDLGPDWRSFVNRFDEA